MTPANSGLTAFLCAVLIGFSGCGQSDSTDPLMSDNDTLLNELLGSVEENAPSIVDLAADSETDSSPQTVSAGLEIPSTENDTSESIVDDILGSRTANSHSVTNSILAGSSPSQFDLAQSTNHGRDFAGGSNVANHSIAPSSQTGSVLQLRAGEQFPFLKTVRQTVVQKTFQAGQASSADITAQTLMQLTMNLSVLDSNASGYVMHVRYERVQYSQDVNGQQQTFDSAAKLPNGQLAHPVPAGIEAYAGMIGAGFRFTLTADNKVAGTDGLGTFLDQCVSAAPFDQRVALRASLEQRFQSGAIAELIDESIGLLPYGSSSVRSGDVWVTDRQLQHQSPIKMQTTCRLLSTSGTAAEIGLAGRIESAAGAPFQISDGRTMGTCLVNLTNGMPVHSKRSSYMKIASQPTAQQTVEITKRIESTFTSQSQAAGLIAQQHRSDSSPQPAAAPITIQARGSSTNIAAPYSSPVQSASLPSSNAARFRGGQNPSLQIHPVSSANAHNGSGTTSGMQIPAGGAGSVPAADLQSTVEAVYPE